MNSQDYCTEQDLLLLCRNLEFITFSDLISQLKKFMFYRQKQYGSVNDLYFDVKQIICFFTGLDSQALILNNHKYVFPYFFTDDMNNKYFSDYQNIILIYYHFKIRIEYYCYKYFFMSFTDYVNDKLSCLLVSSDFDKYKKAYFYLTIYFIVFKGHPIAQIIGYTKFYGLDILCNESTLIPRTDSEFLVQTAFELFILKILNKLYDSLNKQIDLTNITVETLNFNIKITELACGSACISIALYSLLSCNNLYDALKYFCKKNLLLNEYIHKYYNKLYLLSINLMSDAKMNLLQKSLLDFVDVWYISDISKDCCLLSEKNLKMHKIDKIKPVLANIFQSENKIYKLDEADLILANPPYIAYDEKKYMSREVLEFENSQALFSGLDGLDFYRKLINDYLSGISFSIQRRTFFCLECGFKQAVKINDFLNKISFNSQIKELDFNLFSIKDYEENDRVVIFNFE